MHTRQLDSEFEGPLVRPDCHSTPDFIPLVSDSVPENQRVNGSKLPTDIVNPTTVNGRRPIFPFPRKQLEQHQPQQQKNRPTTSTSFGRTKRKRENSSAGNGHNHNKGLPQNGSFTNSSSASGSTSRTQVKSSDTSSNPDRTKECPPKKADTKKNVISTNANTNASSSPIRTNMVEKVPGAPWISKVYNYGAIGLHEEVEDFFEWMSPTDSEHHLRCGLIQRVRHMISEQWSQARVDVFGSFKTGLYLPSSDIDLVIVGYWEELPLRTIERLLLQNDIAEPGSLKVLDKAAVPIVKFTDRVSKIKVDVSFNMNGGLRAAELIKHFRKIFPAMSKLAYVLKQFLHQRDLNEVFTGGLSSYALLLLVVHFLQRHPRFDASTPNSNLGVLLIEFFEYYGRNFNFMKNAIRVKDGGSIISKDEVQRNMKNGELSSLICIEDPLDPQNDVGRSSYGALIVKQAFEKAYCDLTIFLKENAKRRTVSILNQIIQVSDSLCQYRAWIVSLNLPIEASHMNLCEFSKRPLPGTQKPVSIDDIEPKQLYQKEDENGEEEVVRRISSSATTNNDGDNLSSVSSRSSMGTQSIRTSDTDSDILPCHSSYSSSSMSVSPANSEVGSSLKSRGQTLNNGTLTKLNNTTKNSSNTSLASNAYSTSSSNGGGRIKHNKTYWNKIKDHSSSNNSNGNSSADLDMNWRSHEKNANTNIKSKKSKQDQQQNRADQDPNWRRHPLELTEDNKSNETRNGDWKRSNGNGKYKNSGKNAVNVEGPEEPQIHNRNKPKYSSVVQNDNDIVDDKNLINVNNEMSAKEKLTAGLFSKHQQQQQETTNKDLNDANNGNEGEDEKQDNETNNISKAKKFTKRKKKNKKSNNNSRTQTPTEDENKSSSNTNAVIVKQVVAAAAATDNSRNRFSGRPGHSKPNR